jgi:pimeloyl-ACP methyl ester carboxylesterase
VALAFASAHAERVAAPPLANPVTDPLSIPAEQRAGALAALKGPDYLAVISNYYSSIVGPNAQTAAIVLNDVARTPQATIIGAMTALDALRPADLVGSYDGPTLSIVLPANDTGYALHRTGKGFPARHFPSLEVGHWFHLDDPTTFHAMLDAYFDEIARKA